MRGRIYRSGVALSLIASVAVLTLLLAEQTGVQRLLTALGQVWPDWAQLAVSGLGGYLLGSIPFGFIVVGMLRERDITTEGSGRTGGTNALRASGFGAAALTVVGDICKGYAAVVLARALVSGFVWAQVLAGWGAVLGHNASIYIGFKGGAGSGPNMGVAGAFWPPSLIFTLLSLPFSYFVIGYASLGSIFIAAVIVAIFALRAVLGQGPVEYIWYGVGAALLIVYALRPNIDRLIKGTEKRVELSTRQGNKVR
ncbi:MAG TPA: glycerol-3-phosphate acyltransferase [Anaerolineae bacterium]|nr:glycerol-3-phosphate acyltransferase [Anaerolineae bacterium]